MRSVLFALLLIPSPQELTLDALLEKMEAAAAAARGATFEIHSTAKDQPFVAEVAVAKDGTVRFAFTKDRPTTVQVLAPDAFYVVAENPHSWANAQFLPCRPERIVAGEGDPFIQPRGYWQSTLKLNVLFHALSPKRAFAFEQGLRLAGRRKVGGEECYVLVSGGPLSEPEAPGFPGMAMLSGFAKKFFVGAADFRLCRFQERFFFSQQGSGGQAGVCSLQAYEGAVPSRIVVGTGLESYTGVSGQAVIYEARSIAPGAAPEGAALVPSAAELYAGRARLLDVESRLKAAPDDIDLSYSFALFRSNPRVWHPQNPPQMAPVIEAIEKVIEKKWAASPVRNLLSLYASKKEDEKLAALAERVAKDPGRSPAMAFDAARAFSALGKHDRALALLEGLEGYRPDLVVAARIRALLGKGEPAKAVAAFVASKPAADQRFPIAAEARDAYKAEDLVKSLDAAVAADPESAPLHLSRLDALQGMDDPGRVADAVRDLLRGVTEKAAVDSAMLSLGRLFGLERGGQKADPEKLKVALPKVREALEAAGGAPAVPLIRGMASRLAGDREAALRELATACGSLSKAGTDTMWVAALVEAAHDLGDDALVERACRTALEGMRATATSAYYYGDKHPVMLLIKRFVDGRRHGEIYHALKGVDLTVALNLGLFFNLSIPVTELRTIGKAGRDEAMKEKDAAGIAWLARMMDMFESSGIQNWLGGDFGVDVLELYEEAAKRAPADLEAKQGLAEALLRKGDTARAAKEVGEVLAAVEAGAAGPRLWTRAQALLKLAEAHHKAVEPEQARAALEKLDLARTELAPWEAWKGGSLLEQMGEPTRAVPFFERTAEDGYRPHLKLAGLHMERRDWVEAMRHANRALARGWDPDIAEPRKAGAFYVSFGGAPKPVVRPEKLRDEIYKAAGENYFVDRLLANPPAMADDERKRAKEAFEALASDALPEREAALRALQQLGPKCAPIVRPGLESKDGEVRLVVRQLLTDWAEPR